MDTLLWTLWLINAVLGYSKVRLDKHLAGGKWTQWDRLFWAVACLFGGTITLLILLLTDLKRSIRKSQWAQREATW